MQVEYVGADSGTQRLTCRIENGVPIPTDCDGNYDRTRVYGMLAFQLEAEAGDNTDFLGWSPDCPYSPTEFICADSFPSTGTVEFNTWVHFDAHKGAIQVATQTIGSGTDPNGYTVLVGSSVSRPIGVNDEIVVDSVKIGTHEVLLSNLSGNCSIVGPNARDVSVAKNDTTRTEFTVDCVPMVSPTIIEITTSTTGSDLDANAYNWTVESGSQYYNGPIDVNETVEIAVGGPGDYEVELWDVDLNCELDTGSSPNPRTLTVALGDTAATTFSVSCNAWASLQVDNTTTGWDIDADGYMVDVIGFGSPGRLSPNDTTIGTNYLPGTYGVALRELSANCAVQGDTVKTVSVGWGETGEVHFDVACSGILFQSDRDGWSELYVMNSDGSGLERVHASTYDDENPVWAPDRRRIAFSSDRGDGNQEIYVLDLLNPGAGLLQVTDNTWDDDDPVFSPSGDSILISSRVLAGHKELFVVAADGSGAPRQVTDDPSGNDDADWAPVDPLLGTAQWIVFTSARDPEGDDELYRLNLADPTDTPYQLTRNFVKDDDAVFSPDGTRIAFSRRTNGDNRDIFVMYFNGSGVVQLTNQPGDEDDPTWSPDGTRIAFMSNRDGNDEIYVMNADGTGQTRLTSHLSKDDEPAWQR